MNLNQAAHGDREFGHITARMGLARKVVVGFWQDPETISEIAAWTRAAAGWYESQHLKVARFGDNMRDVSVTDGDKVSAEATLGYSVNGYGIGDLAARMNQFSDAEVATLVAQYREDYSIAKEHDRADSIAVAARIELGLEAFLTEGGFGAFTDTFQDLYGLDQLPGIASQRLMAKGFGFAGEGDWKTAALVRTMKVMATGLKGGTSFMEDYTYDFSGTPKILGSHMLEICPSIAAEKPSLEVHPLGIGGKADPVRLVLNAGFAVAAVRSDSTWCLAGAARDPLNRGSELRGVSRVPDLDVVIEDHTRRRCPRPGLCSRTRPGSTEASFANRPGVGIMQADQATAGLRHHTSQPASGLSDHPLGSVHDHGQVIQSAPQLAPALARRAAAGSLAVADHLLGLPDGRLRQIGELASNPSNGGLGLVALLRATQFQLPCDRSSPPTGSTTPIPTTGPGRTTGSFDPLHRPRHLPDGFGQQPGIGRIGHGRGHDRGVSADPVHPQQLRSRGLGQQRLVQRPRRCRLHTWW